MITVTDMSVTFSVSVPSGTRGFTEEAPMEPDGAGTLVTEDAGTLKAEGAGRGAG